jgi:hypothetical protein
MLCWMNPTFICKYTCIWRGSYYLAWNIPVICCTVLAIQPIIRLGPRLEVQRQSFLTFGVRRLVRVTLRPLYNGNHWTGSWLRPKASVDAVEVWKIFVSTVKLTAVTILAQTLQPFKARTQSKFESRDRRIQVYCKPAVLRVAPPWRRASNYLVSGCARWKRNKGRKYERPP